MSAHPPRGTAAQDADAERHAARAAHREEEEDAPAVSQRQELVSPRQWVAVRALEIVAHARRSATDEEVNTARRELTAQARAALGHSDDDEDDEEAAEGPELDEELEARIEAQAHQDIFTAAPADRKALRVRRHVLERQLEPLTRVRVAADLPAAQRQAIENLSELGVFATDAQEIPSPQVMLHLSSKNALLPGNEVHELVGRDSLAHPTLLERVASRALGLVGLGGGDDGPDLPEDGEEDEEDEDSIGRGGIRIPAHMHARLLKATVVLPPEKRAFGLRTAVNTSGTVGTSDLTLSGSLNGPLGFGERWQIDVKQGADSQSLFDTDSNSLNLQVTVPELLTRRSQSTLALCIDKMHMQESSLAQENKGFSISWAPYSSRHVLRYELTQRHLRAVSERLPEQPAPVAAASAAGSSSSSWWPWRRSSAAAAASPSPSGAAAAAASPPLPVGAAPSAAYPAMMNLARKWREPSPSILATVGGPDGVGHSLKSALHYQYACQSASLDSRGNPSEGWSGALRAEYAGVGGLGDASFVKLEGEGRRFWRLPLLPASWKASVGLGGLTQYVHNLSPARSRVYIGDRLWLGSALTLRGLPVNTCGPRDGADSLGGELSVATAAHLGVELRPGVRGHLFWNGGNLLGLHNDITAKGAAAAAGRVTKPAPQGPEGVGVAGSQVTLPRSAASAGSLAQALWDSSRHSVGAGISCDVGGIRFELHFAKPVSQQPQDHKQGTWPIQFGIGMQWV